jgi:BirA family biotin operon repressor/biotin-[acetyl-CoA-carboxylase] ligase
MSFDRDKYQTILLNLSNGRELLDSPLYVYDVIPSTNQILWELLDRGIQPTIAAIALQQTAGRGQWGRNWQSSLGGLYLSVALTVDLAAGESFHLTLSTVLGIVQILRDRNIPVFLKWPNDLILLKRKLGGIKCETRIRQEKIERAIIGVGINWTNPTPEVGISLRSFLMGNLGSSECFLRKSFAYGVRSDRGVGSVGRPGDEETERQGELHSPPHPVPQHSELPITSLEELAAVTTYGIISGYQKYLEQGIDRLLPNYLQLLSNLGQTVKINDSLGEIVGVSTTGELIVRLRSPGASTEIALQPGQISLGYDVGE